MDVIATLREMRDFGGKARTTGLPDATIERFAAHDANLRRAIEDAAAYQKGLRGEMSEFLRMDEDAQIHHLQCGLVNFYPDDGVNPYVPAAARGPWVVTLKGAVLHDDGGYGMLGFGHNPEHILEAMSRPQVSCGRFCLMALARHLTGSRLSGGTSPRSSTGMSFAAKKSSVSSRPRRRISLERRSERSSPLEATR